MLPLTKEEFKLHEDVKVRYICGKESYKNLLKIKFIEKLEIITVIQASIETPQVVFVT